jgi:hypothetical protein
MSLETMAILNIYGATMRTLQSSLNQFKIVSIRMANHSFPFFLCTDIMSKSQKEISPEMCAPWLYWFRLDVGAIDDASGAQKSSW